MTKGYEDVHPSLTYGTKLSTGLKLHVVDYFSIAVALGVAVAESRTDNVAMLHLASSLERSF